MIKEGLEVVEEDLEVEVVEVCKLPKVSFLLLLQLIKTWTKSYVCPEVYNATLSGTVQVCNSVQQCNYCNTHTQFFLDESESKVKTCQFLEPGGKT